MQRGRAHSPLPPPREPKASDRGPYGRGPPSGASRRRSRSPPRARSPPGGYKRSRRDDDYYDRHDRYGSPPRRRHSPDYGRGYDAGYDDGYYHHQPPPPPNRRDERPGEPRSFKRFLVEDVPDNVSPAEAQALYEQYLTAHFGDQLRAKFEQEKTLDHVRAAYHPASFESSLTRHKDEAASTAALLAADIRDGKYDPTRPDFNQGLLDAAEQGEEGGPAPPSAPEGPVCLWKADRVAHDYKTARRLVAIVDSQRGLKLADNPLLPVPQSGAAEGEGDGEAAKEAEAGEGEAADGAAPTGSEAAGLKAVLAEVESEELDLSEERALMDKLGQLDLLLTWLWKVHGIDYYGGRELLLEAEYLDRAGRARTIRGARPEEGEEQDEEEAKADRADLDKRVDAVWSKRMEETDPLLAGCQRDEIEKQLNDYVESQIKMENEKKWGSTFSNKFFLEKRFVVKHIFNKHQQRLDEQREVIRETLYWQAYEAANKAKHAAARKEAKDREAARAVATGGAAGEAGDAHMAEAGTAGGEWQEGYEGDDGFVAAPAAAAGGRGPGRLGPMRGRGARGGMLGRGGRGLGEGGMAAAAAAPAAMMGGAMPIVDPSQLMMMGGMPGPILLPGPMMGGLPGAMPMPMMMPDMGGMPVFIPAQGAGGPPMMRGGMMGGRGGRGRGRGMGGMVAPPGTKLEGPGYLKHYYDLDAPANNRAVLDYGDL